jgi:hypothetical protein
VLVQSLKLWKRIGNASRLAVYDVGDIFGTSPIWMEVAYLYSQNWYNDSRRNGQLTAHKDGENQGQLTKTKNYGCYFYFGRRGFILSAG